MALDPSVDYNAKQILRRPPPSLPTVQYSATPADYAAAGVAPPALPTQSVQASAQDYANAGLNRPVSYADQVAQINGAQADPYAQQALGADPTDTPVTRNIASVVKAAAQPVTGPNPFANVQGSAQTTAVNPDTTAQLAPGVTRYNLGGDGPTSPNATRIYTTRGQHGEDVFTDNANYAARVSTGGLRRGQTGTQAVYNNAQAGPNNPNANYQYAPSTLEQQGGLTPAQLGNLDPQAAQQALSFATAASSANRGTDQGTSDTMDANLLRSRVVGGGASYGGGYGGGSSGGGGGGGGGGGINTAGLPATTQIAAYRAQQTAKYQNQRNQIAQQNLGLAQQANQRQATAAQQTSFQQGIDSYEKAKLTDPSAAANQLVSMIPTDPKEFDKFAATDNGRQVLSTFNRDVLQKGAQSAYLDDADLGGQGQIVNSGLNSIATDPETGQFKGVTTGDGTLIPTQRGLARRVLGGLPGLGGTGAEGLTQYNNFDPSIKRISPAILQRMKAFGALPQQPLPNTALAQ